MSICRPLYVIACATVIEELQPHLPADAIVKVMEFGLHNYPDRLKSALQTEIDAVPAGATILLGYGLCGNGLDGIQAGPHKLVVPRVHDCIALFLGSQEAYQQHTRQELGTYFVTKGWLRADDHGPVSEYRRLVEKYGPERGAYLARMAFSNYTRLVLINTGHYDLGEYRRIARELAENYQLRYEEIKGAPDLVRALARGEWDHRFLIISPGGTIRMSDFLKT